MRRFRKVALGKLGVHSIDGSQRHGQIRLGAVSLPLRFQPGFGLAPSVVFGNLAKVRLVDCHRRAGDGYQEKDNGDRQHNRPVAPRPLGEPGDQVRPPRGDRFVVHDVGAMIEHVTIARGLFGAHIAWRSQNIAADCQIASGLGDHQPEIGDPGVPGTVDQQVQRLNVAVDDAHLVGMFQGLGRLTAKPGDGAVVATVVSEVDRR